MAAPVYGDTPKIRQEKDSQGSWLPSIEVFDHASWFEAQSGTAGRATRWVSVWFWNGTNVFSTPTPAWATNPDHVQPGENMLRLPLGPTNIGGSFYVVEFGGIVYPPFGDNPAAVEWGREFSGNRDDQSKWGARSNTIVVQAWPRPIPPIHRTSTQIRNEVVPLLKGWEAAQSGPIELTRIRLAREVLEMPDATPARPGWTRDRAAAIRDAVEAEIVEE